MLNPWARPMPNPAPIISAIDSPNRSWHSHALSITARFNPVPPMVMRVTETRLPIRPDNRFPDTNPTGMSRNQTP